MMDRANGGAPVPRRDGAERALPGGGWPEPDEALGSALREVVPEAPVERVDWRAFRAAVLARAELPLARLRRRQRQRWWEVTAGWARAAVPAAAAAGVVLALALGAFDRLGAGGKVAERGGEAEMTQVASARGGRARLVTASSRIPLEQALSAGTPQDAITNVLFETAGPDALIRAAVESR